MKLKLKEDPREWLKFIALWMAFAGGLALYVWKKDRISGEAAAFVLGICAGALVAAAIRPIWVRPIYRVVMTGAFRVGQVMGKVLLAVFFVAALTPMALVLRVLRKDLLQLKKSPAASYWVTPKPASSFDTLF